MIKPCAISLALLLGGSSPLALANSDHRAHALAGADYARVLSAQPLYGPREFSQPGAECRPEAAQSGAGSRVEGYRPAAAGKSACDANGGGASRGEVVAYRVHYRYQGHDFITELPYDPGSRLPIDFDDQPIRW
jgi:uncharacterized protein YcfJ